MKEQPLNSQGVIFYDGLCIACSAEINHYRKLKGSESFQFLDITSPEFDAKTHGLDPFLVHKVMHVRSPDGVLHQGVEAFRCIWSHLPSYRFLFHATDNRLAKAVLNLGYQGFVRIRPYLPRRQADCSASPYCESRRMS